MKLFQRKLAILLLGILVACAVSVTVLLVFFLGPWGLRHTTSFYDVLLYHRFHANLPQSDVLVIGDSSCGIGLNPQELELALPQARILNVTLFGYSGSDSYGAVLSRYVRDVGIPRVTVLCLSALTPYYNATLMSNINRAQFVLTEAGWPMRLAYFLGDPTNLVSLIRHFTRRAIGRQFSRTSQYFETTLSQLEHNSGSYKIEQQSLASDCSLHSWQPLYDLRFIGAIKEQIESYGSKPFIFVSPLPDCEADFSRFKQVYEKLADNDMTTLPSSLFMDVNHVTSEGTIQFSRLFTDFLVRQGVFEQPASRWQRRSDK